MEFLILGSLIVLNGLLAMSEIALVAARKARLMKMAADGDGAAAVALQLADDPTKFLSTVQIGITSIGILNGIVGEVVLAEPLAVWLQSLGVAEAHARLGATAGVVFGVTYVSIVIGELVPKRLGQISPEAVARVVARPMRALAFISRPFVWLLTGSTHFLLRLMGVQQNTASGVTEEEIHAILEEGSESGVIERHQHEMVRNVFRLDDRHLGSLMVPRSDIAWVDVDQPAATSLAELIESGHSRLPVCRGDLDHVIGVVHAKRLLAGLATGATPDFTAGLEPCLYVPESLTGMELLERFRASNVQMALVIDEYGEVEGLVSLRDVLEAVLGSFAPTGTDDAEAVQREDGSWLLDGAIPIPDLKDRLELKNVPEEDRGRYHTLSGMVMLLLGRVPATGDYADWSGWRFEVVDMDDKRIDKVLATPLLENETEGESIGD